MTIHCRRYLRYKIDFKYLYDYQCVVYMRRRYSKWLLLCSARTEYNCTRLTPRLYVILYTLR